MADSNINELGNYYDRGFFEQNAKGTLSASLIVEAVLSIIPARSVVDIGCGVGPWSAAFVKAGISDLMAVDGNYVDHSMLLIDEKYFLPAELEKPFSINRTFDLAVSLEVAEHLSSERAKGFVADLVSLAPVVLFSAAVPGQGGTHHINEQWQAYWAQLFATHRYRPLDCLRYQFWNNPEIEVWYRQNMILYIHADQYEKYAHLQSPPPMDIAHPELFLVHTKRVSALENEWNRPTLGLLLQSLPGAIGRSFRKRLLGKE